MRATRVLFKHTPMIRFLGRRSVPKEIDHTPKVHPASPSESLPESFASYRQKASQHGPMMRGGASQAPSSGFQPYGGIGGRTARQLGSVKPKEGEFWDRNELPKRFRRTVYSEGVRDNIKMAYNVFGNPITNETLAAMPEYEGKKITRRDRAHVALNMKNAQDKDKNAREYVERLKQQWGTGVSTLCLIYNATGDTIKFVVEHSWHGHIGPGPYPIEIANGQWGGFLHVKTSGTATGSSAACVYRGLNNDGVVCDWMVAWSNPWNRSASDNTAYTEIREEGHYTKNDHWNYISNLLYDSGLSSSDKWNKCVSNVTTGSDTSPIFEGILTLQDA